MTLLHFTLPSGADVNGIALSPDGTKLAVFYQMPGSTAGGFPYNGLFTLGIYSVATGEVLRSWTGDDRHHGSYAYAWDGLPDPNANLTWTSDGQRLAFAYQQLSRSDTSLFLRELNLADPGGDLFTLSTVVATIGVLNDRRPGPRSGAIPSASPATGAASSAARSCLRPCPSAPRSTR